MSDPVREQLANQVTFLEHSIRRVERLLWCYREELHVARTRLDAYRSNPCHVLDQHMGQHCDLPFGHKEQHSALSGDGKRYSFTGT